MNPDVITMLNGLARCFLLDFGAHVSTPYGSLSVQLAAALLSMIAQDAERIVARLVEENEALIALFADADQVVRDSTLRADLRAATPTPSLLVSELRRTNA